MEKFTLENGLTLLVETMPYLRSASIGVWVKAGSVLETPEENGLSHFMEHMAFKGTQKRTSRQIAEEMDAVGGHLNAATSKLCTNYYAKVIDEDLPVAADILADIVCNPLLDPQETDKERGVVLEEISMVEDSPEDVVFDVLAEAVFGEQALGQTILGPADKIAAYQPEDLRAFRRRHYGPKNAVVAIAGNVEPQRARALIEEKFGDWRGAAGEIFPEEVAIDEQDDDLHHRGQQRQRDGHGLGVSVLIHVDCGHQRTERQRHQQTDHKRAAGQTGGEDGTKNRFKHSRFLLFR